MTCSGCDRSKDAAVKTLERLGYTYHGGEEWKPLLDKPPYWIKYGELGNGFNIYMCPECKGKLAATDISEYKKCVYCNKRLY